MKGIVGSLIPLGKSETSSASSLPSFCAASIILLITSSFILFSSSRACFDTLVTQSFTCGPLPISSISGNGGTNWKLFSGVRWTDGLVDS